MMSLFSSFDLWLFPATLITNTFLIWNYLKPAYLHSKTNLSMNMLKSKIAIFFYSLKSKNFQKFFMMLMTTTFIFVLTLNITSISSYTFPLTSQMSLILFLAANLWVAIVLKPIMKNPKFFLAHLIPNGTPYLLMPFLFAIEMVSNLIRPLTVSVRLVANILAGHILMLLLSELALNNITFTCAYFVLNAVELAVSIIQAYIFCTMISLYYSEIN